MDKDLLRAAKDGHRIVLTNLLRAGANVNTKTVNGGTPLHLACFCGHGKICDILIKYGAEVNASDEKGWSPLHLAALTGHKKLARLLVKSGANVNQKNQDNCAPLHLASAGDHEEVVITLISNGVDVNVPGQKGKTALHVAVENDRENIVKSLLKLGAKIDPLDESGETPLDIAKRKENHKIADILEIKYPLYKASLRGQVEECRRILGDILDVDDAFNPVEAALEAGHPDVVNLLLRYQLNIDYDKIVRELPALYLAVDKGHDVVVTILLNLGADPDTSFNGDSILHVATRKRNSNLVQLLMSDGANPNLKDKLGFTPLHYAVMNGDKATVEELFNEDWEQCANVNATAPNGNTPLHMAFARVDYQIGLFLLRKGANMKALNDENQTPIDILDWKWADLRLLKDVTNTTKESDHYPIFDDLGSTDADLQSDSSEIGPSMGDLKSKISELMSFVQEIEDVASRVEILQKTFATDTDTAVNLIAKKDGNKTKSKRRKVKKETNLQVESDIQGEAKRKQTELRHEIKALQNNIRDLQEKIKILHNDIGQFV